MPSLRRLVLALFLLPLLAGPALAEGPPRLIGRATVSEDGFYRIPTANLEALGAPTPGHVEVRRRGRPVPCNSEKELVFFALDVADHHSKTGTFELWLHERPWTDGPLVMTNLDVVSGAEDEPLPRVVAPDRVYGELASAHPEVYAHSAPTWFATPIQGGACTILEVGPMGAAPDAPQKLLATVYVSHKGAVAVKARWGEHDLGVARAEQAVGGAMLRWSVPAEHVPKGPARLHLHNVSPEIPPAPPKDVSSQRDTVWVDAVALRGPARPDRAGPRLLGWKLRTAGELRFKKKGIACLVILAPDGTPLAIPRTGGGGYLGEAETGTLIYAAHESRVVEPVAAVTPPHPLGTAGTARHVILAVPPLVEPALTLATHRTKTGTPSAVVPVADVYAHYGHGEARPDAIRRFVEDLMKREGTPLEFLVLAGDATFDRTDLLQALTIPTNMGRSMYNGATSADRRYALPLDGSQTGGPSIGRLPFRKAETMRAYVDRVVRYETKPPAHVSRRTLRFVTSEGRFGAFLDRLIENVFRNVITNEISPAYDIEVTFASQTSAFLWPPPEFNDKVIQDLNDGALFFTYVGHGFSQGFDNLYVGDQRHRILHVHDVPRVDVKGTPPAVFVLACTTAMFDGLEDGVGEALLKQPHGPVAYWGATRICHPAFNTLMGQAIARFMTKEGATDTPRRLGQVLDHARDETIHPTRKSLSDRMLRGGIKMLAEGADVERLILEGAQMYVLLGDPALKVAQPAEDLRVEAGVDEATGEVVATIQAELPAGTTLQVSLELPRNRNATNPTAVPNPTNPASYDAIRKKHDAMNDWALVRKEVVTTGATTEVRFPLGEKKAKGLIVKAWTIAGDGVHQGAAVLK